MAFDAIGHFRWGKTMVLKPVVQNQLEDFSDPRETYGKQSKTMLRPLLLLRTSGGGVVKYAYQRGEDAYVVSADIADSGFICTRYGCQFRRRKPCKHLFYALWNDKEIPVFLAAEFLRKSLSRYKENDVNAGSKG